MPIQNDRSFALSLCSLCPLWFSPYECPCIQSVQVRGHGLGHGGVAEVKGARGIKWTHGSDPAAVKFLDELAGTRDLGQLLEYEDPKFINREVFFRL